MTRDVSGKKIPKKRPFYWMLREHVTRDVRTVEEHGGMLLLVASMAAALLPSLAAALLPLLTERLRNRRIFFF